jgi:hypothetical protein
MASKHSKGFGLPARALIVVGVTMTNLLDDSLLLFSTLLPITLRIALPDLLLPSDLTAGDFGLEEDAMLSWLGEEIMSSNTNLFSVAAILGLVWFHDDKLGSDGNDWSALR